MKRYEHYARVGGKRVILTNDGDDSLQQVFLSWDDLRPFIHHLLTMGLLAWGEDEYIKSGEHTPQTKQ